MRISIVLSACMLYVFGCNTSKIGMRSDDCKHNAIILEIKKKSSALSLDVTRDYFLLHPIQGGDTASLSIKETAYRLYFLDINAPHGAKNCCLQGNDQNRDREIKLSNIYFNNDDIFNNSIATCSFKSGDFRLRYFVMSDNDYCICSDTYSSTTQEITEQTTYLTDIPRLVKCKKYANALEKITDRILITTEYAQ